jgi:hypothetical protein
MVVIKQHWASPSRGYDPEQAYYLKARLEFAGDDPSLLVHLNRARSFAALIALAIVAGLYPARSGSEIRILERHAPR